MKKFNFISPKVYWQAEVNNIKKINKREIILYYISIFLIIFSSVSPFFVPIFFDFGSILSANINSIQANPENMGADFSLLSSSSSATFSKMFYFFIITTLTSIIGILGVFLYKKKQRKEGANKRLQQVLNKIPGISYDYFFDLVEKNKVTHQHMNSNDSSDLGFSETGYNYYQLEKGIIFFLESNKNPKEDKKIKDKINNLSVLPKLTYYLTNIK